MPHNLLSKNSHISLCRDSAVCRFVNVMAEEDLLRLFERSYRSVLWTRTVLGDEREKEE